MNTTRIATALFMAVCVGSPSAALPSADQIIKRCMAVYDSATSFQGVVEIKMLVLEQRVTTTGTVVAATDGKGKIAGCRINMVGVAPGAHGPKSTTLQFYSTPTIDYSVNVTAHQYYIRHHSLDRVSDLFKKTFDGASSAGPLHVSVTRINGRPVYRLATSGKSGAVTIIIDMATFQLVSSSRTGGEGLSKFEFTLTASKQVFNKPVSEAEFHWSPPPGYVQVKGDGGPLF